MSRIHSRDTKLELLVRSVVHGLGYRYRLHDNKLPGRPDLVFKRKRKIIFIHGCFWHQHGCSQYRMPKTRINFWAPKLKKNIDRDKAVMRELRNMGWAIQIVWECETNSLESLKKKIDRFLK